MDDVKISQCKYEKKRATIWGLILFWIIFVIATVIQIISPGDLIIGIVVMPFVIFFYSKFVYFRKEDSEVTIKEGFLVGLYWSFISIICDIIFVVYLLGIGWVLFSSWALYVHYIQIVVFTILGALTEKK